MVAVLLLAKAMPFNLLFNVEDPCGAKDFLRFKDSFSFKDKRIRNKRDNRTAVATTWLTTLYLIVGALVVNAAWPAIALAEISEAVTPNAELSGTELSDTELSGTELSGTELSDAEIPEEILRTEIITEARSPLTGEPMSAADYAQLQAELSAPTRESVTISDDLRYLVFLLQIRQTVRPIVPFW